MSGDKLVDSTQLDSDLTSVANAIRTKGGTSASLAFPSGFVSAIDAIPTGGGSGLRHETGTIIPSIDITGTDGNHTYFEITTISDIGFVPKIFIFRAVDYTYAPTGTAWLVYSMYDADIPLKIYVRRLKSTMSLSAVSSVSELTSDKSSCILLNNGSICISIGSSCSIHGGSEYTWEAFG